VTYFVFEYVVCPRERQFYLESPMLNAYSTLIPCVQISVLDSSSWQGSIQFKPAH